MNESHLDDEQLSASLDGEPGPGADAHLGTCRACAGRRDALAAVRRAVATPPPGPAAGVADRVVAAAAAAFAEERGDDRVVPLRRPAAAAEPVPPARRAPAPPPPGRRRVPTWAMAAAALVAAVVVAVPVLSSLDSGDDTRETAAAPGSAEATVAEEVAVLDGGDLGDQADAGALTQVLGRAVTGTPTGDSSFAAAPAPASDDARTASGAEASPTEDSGPPATVAPQTTATAGRRSSPPCAAEARAEFGSRLGPLLYSALLRWQGTPAVVLAYRLAEPGSPGLDHTAFVMSREGCRLLVAQGF